MSFLSALRSRAQPRPALPIVPTTESCKGATFVVTGANTGLGLECAKHLVRLSSKKVILAVRTLSKGEEAKAKIEADTGHKGIAEVWQLDLNSYESVKNFASKLGALDRLDAVIENAGIALDRWALSEGLETSITVNVVSTMLLAALVLPKLQESATNYGISPRLSIVGSEVAFMAKGALEAIDGDILEGLSKEKPSVDANYPNSKLLQLYAVRELAKLHPVGKTGVIINYVNPGLCSTELNRHVRFAMRAQINMMRLLMGRTAEEGSRTLLYGAFAERESHGTYTEDCRVAEERVESWITDDAGQKMQRRVWNDLASRLNTIQPGCV